MNLAEEVKEKEYPSTAGNRSSSEKKEKRYPSVSLHGKAMKHLHREHGLKVGDEFTAKVRMKVRGHHESDNKDDHYGNSMDCHMTSIDDIEKCGDEDKEPKSGALE